MNISSVPNGGGSRPARLPLWLADQIEAQVLDGDHTTNAQLPTELALAQDYSVSRQVVREAARLLEDRGLVNIRPGRGMTVAEPSAAPAVQRYRTVFRRGNATFAQLMELRRTIEPDMTALAACNRTEADVERLRRVLAQSLAHLDDYRACVDADLAFHLGVAKATNNPFVAAFVEPINTVLRELYSEPVGYLATQESTIREHGEIADAIDAGDAGAARAAAAAHLERITTDAAKLVGEELRARAR